jgi:hypothetical protein
MNRGLIHHRMVSGKRPDGRSFFFFPKKNSSLLDAELVATGQ